MPSELRLLVVEDSEFDAILLLETLASAGFVVTHRRVETAQHLREALNTEDWQCIVSDFSLPRLTAPDVLRILAESGRDIPCIVVSGTIGEEAAIQVLTSGASDFVVKGRLARLGPAIHRELREAEQRRQRRESEKNFRALFAANPVPMYVFDPHTLDFLEVNDATVRKYGYTRDEFLAMRLTDIRRPEDVPRLIPETTERMDALLDSGVWRHRLKSGSPIDVEITTHTFTFAGREAVLVAAVDCTERLAAQRALEERSRTAALTADIGVALNSAQALDTCLQQCAEALVRRLAAGVARIWTMNRHGDRLELQASAGIDLQDENALAQFPFDHSTIEQIAQTRRPLVSNSMEDIPDRRVQAWTGRHPTGAFAGYPLVVEDRVVGVMALRACYPLEPATLAALTAITDHLALGIERYRAEAAARQLAAIVENSEDVILSIALDGTIMNWNAAAEHVYGYSAGEAVGQSLALIIPPDLPQELDRILSAVHEGVPLHIVRTSRLHKDGSRIPMALTLSPIKDAAGRVIGGSSIGRDITDRLRAEQVLHDTEERMRFALDASRVGIWEADLQTGVTRWSEICEALHGLAPGSFASTFAAFVDRIHPEDRQHTLQGIEQATRGHTDSKLLYRTVWPNGTVRWIGGAGRSHYDEAGTPVRAAGVTFDVTEQRALEAQIRQAQKMEAVGQLAGGVAHDFNNLLTAILGYGNLLLDCAGVDTPAYQHVAEILKAGESAATLTRQLLAFGRRQVTQPKIVTVNAVVADIERLLTRLIGENVKLVSRLDPWLHCVRIDPGQLEQVLVNLAVNARDAMPSGGTLTIETRNVELDESFRMGHVAAVPGPYVMVAVSDTGSGMDAEVQARLFEPFFTTKAPGKGTGLGLATVYGIVKQSDGLIYVYSEVGCGTAFKIYLPATMEAPSMPVEATAPPATQGSETILVVEDNAAARRLVRAVLTRQGYDVLDAPSGEEAIQLMDAQSRPIDLVITDVVMTGMTGVDLARRLALTHPDLRILFTSGYARDVAFRSGELGREVMFLEKPYTPAVLSRVVRAALDGRLVG